MEKTQTEGMESAQFIASRIFTLLEPFVVCSAATGITKPNTIINIVSVQNLAEGYPQ